MRYTRILIGALVLFSTACSNEQGERSFVGEAQAATVAANDYGWRTSGNFSVAQKEVREYY